MGCELDKVVTAINKVASEVRDPRATDQLKELINDLNKFAISMETAKPTRDFSNLRGIMSNVEVKPITNGINSNVKVIKLDDLKIKPVFSDAGIKTIRDYKTTEHFGNPFLSTRNFKDKGVGTDEEVAKMFSDWLKGVSNKDVEPKRREWIIKQILDGNLDNKPLLYYANTPVNHAKELEKLINNKSLLSTESSSVNPINTAISRPEFDKLPFYKDGQKTMTYAGIGSRETPIDIQKEMYRIGKELESLGYIGQSGGAPGADKAFEGANQPWEKEDGTVAGTKEFTKSKANVTRWAQYGKGRNSPTNMVVFKATDSNDTVRKIAKEIHPKKQDLSEKDGLDLHARNTFQVFGKNLDTPVDFVLFYAEEQKDSIRPKGGTGQAVEMARLKGIPTINMANSDWKEQLDKVLGNSENRNSKIFSELPDNDNTAEVQSKKENTIIEFDEKLYKKIANKLKSIYKDIEVMYLNGQNEMRAVLEELSGGIAMFQLSKKRKDEFENKLRKARPELDGTGIDKILSSIEEFSETESNGDEKLMKKLELLSLHWTLKGNVILPEDGSKIVSALRISNKNKFDPFKYNNPNEIIEKFAIVKEKTKALSPDMFLGRGYDNKQEWEEGITVYDVENSELGRKISRKMIDTHFGEDSNPWCLLAKRNGSIEDTSTYWFKTYPGEKKIAFRNGKLVAFYGGDKWWDRMDNPFDGVPSKRTGAVISSDKDITELITVNENGVKSIIGYEKKGKKNSIKKWDENKNLILEITEDGSTVTRREDGSISVLIKNIKIDDATNQEEVTKFSVPDKNGKTFITEKIVKTESAFIEDYRIDTSIVTYTYYENGQVKSIHDNSDYTTKYYDPEGNRIDYYESIDIDNLVRYGYITFNEDGSVNGLNDVTRNQYVSDVENRTGIFASVDELPDMFDDMPFEIPFQKSNDIIKGAAVIDKRKILIDISSRSTDTLAHEYAHFYIAAFRDTPIVQEAIKKWGNEENLVQAIGEQTVSKKGAAYGFWKRFTKWVRDLVSNLDKATKEDLVKALTDAFLTNTNLREYSNNSNKNTVNSKRKEGIIAPINSQTARDIQGCSK